MRTMGSVLISLETPIMALLLLRRPFMVLYRSVLIEAWTSWVKGGYCIDGYEIRAPERVDGRPPSRLQRGRSSRPSAEGLLAQRLRGHVAPGSDPGHGHQPPEPLCRVRQQGSAVPQGARSLQRWAGSLRP